MEENVGTDQTRLYKKNEDGTYTVAGKVFDEEIDDYYFESDSFALKENSDYRRLLKTLAILEAQRTRAIQDLDLLHEARHSALADPIAFVERLQRNEDLHLPKPQKLCELPDIDWEKYTTKLGSVTHRHMTRNKRPAHVASGSSTRSSTSSNSAVKQPPGSSSTKVSAETEDGQVVRGRICAVGKSQTFNLLWTPEEQKRLERLLIEYPPEDVEARRWEKIAKALGSRDPLQVASRVQKYFIKLTEIGRPVPGRMPNVNSNIKRAKFHRRQKHHRFLYRGSTFFTSHEPPVYMSDNDDEGTMHSNTSSTDGDFAWTVNHDYDNLRMSRPQRELSTIDDFKDFIYAKSRYSEPSTSGERNDDVKCFLCRCEPIIGTRYRCIDCPRDSTLVLCENCYTSDVETSTHRSNHRLEAITEDDGIIDKDYVALGDSYLDPNYMPIRKMK